MNWHEPLILNAATVLNCKLGNVPFKYLGLPVGSSPAKKEFRRPVIEKFQQKLSSWKCRLLSAGGRAMLVTSVLSALPLYYCSLFLMPQHLHGRGRAEISQLHDILQSAAPSKLQDDSLNWSLDNSSMLTAAMAYAHLSSKEAILPEACISLIWHKLVPPRVKIFSWKFAHHALPTKGQFIAISQGSFGIWSSNGGHWISSFLVGHNIFFTIANMPQPIKGAIIFFSKYVSWQYGLSGSLATRWLSDPTLGTRKSFSSSFNPDPSYGQRDLLRSCHLLSPTGFNSPLYLHQIS